MHKTSHRRRFHTDRIVANRRARYKRETRWLVDEYDLLRLSYGRLADRDPWDCGSHCYLCHYDKFCIPRRAREKRAWKRDWL